jgi:hypothetical protein
MSLVFRTDNLVFYSQNDLRFPNIFGTHFRENLFAILSYLSRLEMALLYQPTTIVLKETCFFWEASIISLDRGDLRGEHVILLVDRSGQVFFVDFSHALVRCS